jgi:hypothetical protein
MARGYVAIREKARRNQEVAALKGDYMPGDGSKSSWNAHEKGWKKRYTREEIAFLVAQQRQAQAIAYDAVAAAIAANDAKRGYVPKRLGKYKAKGR